MSTIPKNMQEICERVNRMAVPPRGYTPAHPVDAYYRADYAEAVDSGYLTPVARGWGHRLTGKGREALAAYHATKAALHADLRAGGFDPDKPVSEMTSEEVDRYIAWAKSRKEQP